jgi:hypothetical protein
MSCLMESPPDSPYSTREWAHQWCVALPLILILDRTTILALVAVGSRYPRLAALARSPFIDRAVAPPSFIAWVTRRDLASWTVL